MAYIHPNDPEIWAFAKMLCRRGTDLRSVCDELLKWFNQNVAYSRMNAPFFPLQRSDLDVLHMKAGTCGDYASLIVSVLTVLGFDAQYAYVRRDCYGDAQDHFCAAVLDQGAYILVDATQPYRKWHGFDCPHREYELLSPAEFEEQIKAEERYWTDYARMRNRPMLAGLLYAPWLHMDRVKETDEALEQIFYLLSCNDPSAPILYVYYHQDCKDSRKLPVMAAVSVDGIRYSFSIFEPEELWDSARWSDFYEESQIPEGFVSEELEKMKSKLFAFLELAKKIIP